MHIEVPALPFESIAQAGLSESSAQIRARVSEALARQQKRYAALALHNNAQLRGRSIEQFCTLQPQAKALLKSAMAELGLTARSYEKILKIARTVADLAACESILPEHVAEAISYRNLDRQLWS